MLSFIFHLGCVVFVKVMLSVPFHLGCVVFVRALFLFRVLWVSLDFGRLIRKI